MASFATDQLSNPKVKPSNITFQLPCFVLIKFGVR